MTLRKRSELTWLLTYSAAKRQHGNERECADPEVAGVVKKQELRETRFATRLLAHDAIRVPVPHVPIRWVRTRYRSDAVPTGFLAGDPPVSIVVVPN